MLGRSRTSRATTMINIHVYVYRICLYLNGISFNIDLAINLYITAYFNT